MHFAVNLLHFAVNLLNFKRICAILSANFHLHSFQNQNPKKRHCGAFCFLARAFAAVQSKRAPRFNLLPWIIADFAHFAVDNRRKMRFSFLHVQSILTSTYCILPSTYCILSAFCGAARVIKNRGEPRCIRAAREN